VTRFDKDRPDGRLRSPKLISFIVFAFLLFIASSAGVGWQLSQPAKPDLGEDEPHLASFDAFAAPLPSTMNLDPERVSLGRDLFRDPRLSGNQDLACVSCHLLEQGGDDGLSRSYGTTGAQTGTNSLTVLNSGLQFTLFWDGRVSSLEDQIDGPLLNPNIMAASWPIVIARLSADEGYRKRFLEIYGGEITPDTVKNAIATFERSLITPHSPFDRFLLGDEGALTEREIAGFELFRSLGCGSCHQGRLLGGNLFQRLGIYRDYFEERGRKTQADNGRFNVTEREEDLHYFRVPSLRNVASTAPYFHDGSVETLGEAVELMAEYQLGRTLTTEERDLLIAFLHTLTGVPLGDSILEGGSS
jgi:cytochrome c peroxidase